MAIMASIIGVSTSAGAGRGAAEHALDEQRDEHDRAEHPDADRRSRRGWPRTRADRGTARRGRSAARRAAPTTEHADQRRRRRRTAPTIWAEPQAPPGRRARWQQQCRERRRRAARRPCSRPSSRAPGAAGSAASTATMTSAISATGSETMNTQRQFALSAIQPPVVGPRIDARPNTAPVRPCQRPRSDGGTRSPIDAMASGISAPAPMPWMPRATIELRHRAATWRRRCRRS